MVSGLNGLNGTLVLRLVEGALKHTQELAQIQHHNLVVMTVVKMTLEHKIAMKMHVLLLVIVFAILMKFFGPFKQMSVKFVFKNQKIKLKLKESSSYAAFNFHPYKNTNPFGS